MARCIFRSLTEKPILALLVDVACTDVWGKQAKSVEGFQFLDLKTKRDSTFGQTKPIPIPDSATRAIEIVIKKVLYNDRTMVDASPDVSVLPKQDTLETFLGTAELAKEYARESNERAKYTTVEGDHYWRCACGAINSKEESKCYRCNAEKAQLISLLNVELISSNLDAFKEEKRLKAEREQAEREEQLRQAEERMRLAQEEKERKEKEEAERKAEELRQRKAKRKKAVRAVMGIGFGLAIGLIRPEKKRILFCVIGGLAGAFAGGFLFNFVCKIIPNDIVARAVALVITGVLIGVGVGLLEQFAKQAWLKVIRGEFEGKEYLVFAGTTSIGNNGKNTIVLFKDKLVGPHHCDIVLEGSKYVLVDCGTPMGTIVNGMKTSRHVLKQGDAIAVGNSVLVFNTK